jgi:hypothetical protein
MAEQEKAQFLSIIGRLPDYIPRPLGVVVQFASLAPRMLGASEVLFFEPYRYPLWERVSAAGKRVRG